MNKIVNLTKKHNLSRALTLWELVRERCAGTGLGVELWLGRKWSRQ